MFTLHEFSQELLRMRPNPVKSQAVPFIQDPVFPFCAGHFANLPSLLSTILPHALRLKKVPSMRKPEIMSPAGYWPQLQAAIDAGADSVYFGLHHFSARAKVGFSLTELPEVMSTLHKRGARGYITFNTLIFEHEIAEAAHTIEAIAKAGADAMIIQDYGILRLAHEIAPEMELHASTQMSITDAAGVRRAQSAGVQRVTLARELSLPEVRTIVDQTGCEIEIFVHGALCVAYSGQCFSSEAWGGRSANRGQCAQACRLPYELLVDGNLEPLGDARYLLSPGDLYTLQQVPEIVAAGVSALKIEGRYKDADYVALTTAAYRKAVDAAWSGQPAGVTREEELQLEQVYSRGLGPFFATGTNHQTVVTGRSPRHRGINIARVRAVESDHVLVEPTEAHEIAPLKAGDGLVFDAADWRSPQEPEEGGRVYQSRPLANGQLQLYFGNGAVRFSRIRSGDLVWRTHDPDLVRAVRQLTPFRRTVDVRVIAHEGEPLVAEWTSSGHKTTVQSGPLSKAQNRALSLEALRDQFGRLGSTPYELGELTLDLQGQPFAPASMLNQLRRDAVEQLQAVQARPPIFETHAPPLNRPANPSIPGAPQLHLLVRTSEQLEAAISVRPATITLDYLDLYGLRPSIERVKASGIAVRVASPRVLKPGEARIMNFLVSLDCPVLVRGAGMIDELLGKAPLIGDFSLNAANSLTAEMYLSGGLDRITPTHDLNAAQITALARKAGAHRLEVIAYQHLPVFHTEHCVFCRFLSTGTSYKDCGRPCEEHKVALQDQSGRAHPVMADVGCRNTVFGAEAQEASMHLDAWRSAGIAHYRLEFVHETAADVTAIAGAFSSALAGRTTSSQLTAKLKQIAPQGVTEGSLYVPAGYQELPILQ
jgi:putative protease